MFQPFDKLEFLGVGMPYGIYTFISTVPDIEGAIQVRRGDVVRNVDASLFKFIRHGAPLYTERASVRVAMLNEFADGVVVEVLPSYTNGPNKYKVNVLSPYIIDGTDPLTLEEAYLFPRDLPTMDSTATTMRHINRVAELVTRMAIKLLERATRHDASKLVSPEKDILDIMEYINKTQGQAPYGSPEYARRTRILKPFLDHHYQSNDHHPEYHPNGLYSMDLLQIVEMAMDWAAATERNGDAFVNLTFSAERFCLDDQVKKIIANTYDKMGIKWA